MVSNSFFERGLRGERSQTCPYVTAAGQHYFEKLAYMYDLFNPKSAQS